MYSPSSSAALRLQDNEKLAQAPFFGAGSADHADPKRKPQSLRNLCPRLQNRKELAASEYHSTQMKNWMQRTKATLESGTSAAQRECLVQLMEEFCRPLSDREMVGDYVQTEGQTALHAAQKGVLEIISRRMKHLKPEDRYLLLRTLIRNHLRHMGHSVDAAHDPQRKAITMLGELLPKVDKGASRRADLAAHLLDAHSNCDICTNARVGRIFNVKVLSTSDFAVRLVEREFHSARRMASDIDEATRAHLQQAYDRAVVAYTPDRQGRTTNLHTPYWKNTFNDYRMNPSEWFRNTSRDTRSHDALDSNAWRLRHSAAIEKHDQLQLKMSALASDSAAEPVNGQPPPGKLKSPRKISPSGAQAVRGGASGNLAPYVPADAQTSPPGQDEQHAVSHYAVKPPEPGMPPNRMPSLEPASGTLPASSEERENSSASTASEESSSFTSPPAGSGEPTKPSKALRKKPSAGGTASGSRRAAPRPRRGSEQTQPAADSAPAKIS